ncbi:MAG: 3'-5' exonuclease [Solirubrobacteraceae bacterium]|jgi:DNA polymerase-3 subunit epsilon
MSWHLQRLAAFDIETTGVDTEHDRIVTAAVSLVGGGQPSEHRSWLVNPGIEIPAGATAVHGITTERARAEGRIASEAVAEITAALSAQLRGGVPIIAFNARFDLTILDREAQRYGLQRLVELVGGADSMLVVDPHVLDKQVDRFRRGKRTLSAVCEHYRVRLDQAHEANSDALAAARVAYRLGAEFAELGGSDLKALHREQVAWAAEQAASLEDYFRKQGRNEPIERVWPVIPSSLPRAA